MEYEPINKRVHVVNGLLKGDIYNHLTDQSEQQKFIKVQSKGTKIDEMKLNEFNMWLRYDESEDMKLVEFNMWLSYNESKINYNLFKKYIIL